MKKIKVTSDAFEYLFIQRGDISHIEEFGEWLVAYEAALYAQLASIAAFLPKGSACSALDIGGGMGGINILLADCYDYYRASIVDGLHDPCVMHRHAQTFNNANVGIEFLDLNGVPSIEYRSPDWDFATDRVFDLVFSFASYCFHYPPSIYLDRLRKVVTDDTVLIFDVRRDRDWESQLLAAFGPAQIVAEGRKFRRLLFRGVKNQ